MATKHLMTVDEFLNMSDAGRYDLIRGEIVKMPPAGFEHGDIALTIGAGSGFIRARGTDVVLDPKPPSRAVTTCRLDRSDEGVLKLAPDLTFEVKSSRDSAR